MSTNVLDVAVARVAPRALGVGAMQVIISPGRNSAKFALVRGLMNLLTEGAFAAQDDCDLGLDEDRFNQRQISVSGTVRREEVFGRLIMIGHDVRLELKPVEMLHCGAAVGVFQRWFDPNYAFSIFGGRIHLPQGGAYGFRICSKDQFKTVQWSRVTWEAPGFEAVEVPRILIDKQEQFGCGYMS